MKVLHDAVNPCDSILLLVGQRAENRQGDAFEFLPPDVVIVKLLFDLADLGNVDLHLNNDAKHLDLEHGIAIAVCSRA